MTRFARRKISKDVNKNCLEDATPWHQLVAGFKRNDKIIDTNKIKCKNSVNNEHKNINCFEKSKINLIKSVQCSKCGHDEAECIKRARLKLQCSKCGHDENECISRNAIKGKFDGFSVYKDDVKFLNDAKQNLYQTGVSSLEVKNTLQLLRRRSEKKLKHELRKMCFNCRMPGHILKDCPDTTITDLCFKCGSTEHMCRECPSRQSEFKFANCFICKQQGHLSSTCPKNSKGKYPYGGACKQCGDTKHYIKDCPQSNLNQDTANFIKMIDDPMYRSVDADDMVHKMDSVIADHKEIKTVLF